MLCYHMYVMVCYVMIWCAPWLTEQWYEWSRDGGATRCRCLRAHHGVKMGVNMGVHAGLLPAGTHFPAKIQIASGMPADRRRHAGRVCGYDERHLHG